MKNQISFIFSFIKASLFRNKTKQAQKGKMLLRDSTEEVVKESDLASRKSQLSSEGSVLDSIDADQKKFQLNERNGISNFFSLIKSFVDKRFLWGLLVGICLSAIGFGTYILSGGSKQPQMVLSFVTKDCTAIEAIKANLSGIEFSQKEGTLTLVKPKETVANVNVMLADSVTLKFETGDTYRSTMGGLLGSNVDKFRTFFNQQNAEDVKATNDTVKIIVQSPGERAVHELLRSDLEIIPLIDSCAMDAVKYPKHGPDFVAIAYERVGEYFSEQELQAYKVLAESYGANDYLDFLKSQVKKSKAFARNKQLEKLRSLEDKLSKIDCTMQDVDNLRNFLEKNPDLSTFALKKKIECYSMFFRYPFKGFEISSSDFKIYFTPRQAKLFEYLCKQDEKTRQKLLSNLHGKNVTFSYLEKELQSLGVNL